MGWLLVEERGEGGDDVGWAAVEVQVGEVAHLPAVGGEPVHPGPITPKPVTVQVGRAVVLDSDPALSVAEVKAVQRYPVAVGDPELRLRRRKTAIDHHQPELAFLATFRARVGAWHEFACLADAAQAFVPIDLDPKFLWSTGTDAKTQVQQRHHVHPTQ